MDLTGHTGNNRLGVFARKPAPAFPAGLLIFLRKVEMSINTSMTSSDFKVVFVPGLHHLDWLPSHHWADPNGLQNLRRVVAPTGRGRACLLVRFGEPRVISC